MYPAVGPTNCANPPLPPESTGAPNAASRINRSTLIAPRLAPSTDPASITTPDFAMELCDGEPSFVQEELDYYLASVKFYCPWGAKVIARSS